MSSKDLSQADLARLAGVSRAAVSKWFRSQRGWVNVESQTLIRLAEALQVEPSVFLERRLNLGPMETRFLWDRLYPDMETFLKALSEERLPAIARLVQVLGFRQSGALIGKKALLWFDRYKKFIHPARRKQLEVLCSLYPSHR